MSEQERQQIMVIPTAMPSPAMRVDGATVTIQDPAIGGSPPVGPSGIYGSVQLTVKVHQEKRDRTTING